MDFRIADTFTDSLARLTGDEQKAVKTTAFDLQLNPAHPSMSLHRIEQSKDKHFWSVPSLRLACHLRCSMSMWRPRAAMCRSSPCTWPRDWNSVPWW